MQKKKKKPLNIKEKSEWRRMRISWHKIGHKRSCKTKRKQKNTNTIYEELDLSDETAKWSPNERSI